MKLRNTAIALSLAALLSTPVVFADDATAPATDATQTIATATVQDNDATTTTTKQATVKKKHHAKKKATPATPAAPAASAQNNNSAANLNGTEVTPATTPAQS